MIVQTVSSRQRVAALVGIIGAAVVVAGTFVGWVRADVLGFGVRSGNGWNNVMGEVSWGPLFTLIAVAVALCLAPALASVRSEPALMFAGGAAALSVALAVYQLWDISRGAEGVDTTLLVGTPLILAGSLLAAGGSLLSARGTRSAIV